MTDFGPLIDIVLLVVAALLPALIYLAWVRSGESGYPEPWSPLLGAFLTGALGATFAAALIEGALLAGGTAFSQAYPKPEFVFLNGNSTVGVLFLVLVIAPVVEEGLKAWGTTSYGPKFRRLADGPVFGAGVGLGFGFFETFLYGLGAYLTGGIVAGLALIVVRSLSSVLLHGSSTAVFGYGYAKKRFGASGSPEALGYGAAVGLHATFNALASLPVLVLLLGLGNQYADAFALLGLGLAILLAFSAIEYVRSLVLRESYAGAGPINARYRPPAAGKPRIVSRR
ncbi:MAG: PrsW family intramembrane metalloprotease [Thermoplasmata archaeon]|nr:PrsW family intramembrane metalloprotease [Thermoplasmata archaeon]